MLPDSTNASMRAPSPSDIRTMLSDVCTNSGADVGFDKLTFSINGSDDTVKAAMMVIAQIPFVKRAQYQIRVKIELANEHKEFVSGKKNGKINKIMGQSRLFYFLNMGCSLYKTQAMSRSFLTDLTSTTSISMFVALNMTPRRTDWTLSSRRCQHRSPSTSLISIISESLVLVASISSAS